MRLLEAIEAALPPSSSTPDPAAADTGSGGKWFHGWLMDCHGLWHNLLLILPSALFLIYLASQAKKNYPKILNGRSHIITALYGFLWLVSILNLAWCSLQVWECSGGKQLAWNILSLLTTSGMMFLEVSLIAFLLQGNYSSGQEALTRTFLISGLVVGLDMFLKAIYIFGFGIQLFVLENNGSQWGLWVLHKLLLTAAYGLIFFMYRSRWRERLPARPAFYNYISIMLGLNVATLFACALAANGAGFGLWLYNIMVIFYHAFYLPLLYVTFLADFFQEEHMNLENAYYSEMKDAGFFDIDWEDNMATTP
ncbi:protein CANDIDATE G-PROTEIN COUPLED RECEPTOR 2 [Ipomoea triloba]|uniref:protein CANDIDATE G-PROTEIN COUPLED RECEPTOR 2 n=1 Tax=Ipomoea triloba TaxID=35885 RepID=UPI00125E1B1B|nr:protein CANDIDATE G-PROTEIN COUPLED RECEPTOR 2 [Ipomoea triloba]